MKNTLTKKLFASILILIGMFFRKCKCSNNLESSWATAFSKNEDNDPILPILTRPFCSNFIS